MVHVGGWTMVTYMQAEYYITLHLSRIHQNDYCMPIIQRLCAKLAILDVAC